MQRATRGIGWVAFLCLVSACSAHDDGAAQKAKLSGSSGGDTGAAATGTGGSDGGSSTGQGGSNTQNTGGTSASGGSGGTSGGTGGSSGSAGSSGGLTGHVSTGMPPACVKGATYSGKTGVWENVTPSGINVDPKFNPADNFGVQDVLADPSCPGTFYAFVCYQGVWKSTDFGSTWTQVDTDGNLEQGRPWGEVIAPDGSYMLACTGYGTARWGAWKSTDGGATWDKYPIADNSDPYMYDIDPADKNHVISTSHSLGNIYESTDAGESWTDKGDGGVGESGYAFFITSTTWLLVAQAGAGGTRLTTDSGKTWNRVGDMEHVHGGEQIYVDPMSHDIYVPSHASATGVYRSTDGGKSFTQVSTGLSAAIFATDNTIYAMDSGASLAGNAPNPFTSSRSDGTTWSAMSAPAEMTNGPKRGDVSKDSSGKWVVVTGDWNAGIWRYAEP